MNYGSLIRAAFPSRRDKSKVVEAKENTLESGDFDPIVAPKAQDRLLELIEREQLPGDVRDTLAGALTGDLQRQQLLFQAMIDTWPRLQKNLSEVFREVKKAPWSFDPYCERGEEPKDSAIEKAALAEKSLQDMTPRPAYGERGNKGLIEDLAFGYFSGHQVVELRWSQKYDSICPRAAKVCPPRFYGYPIETEGEDRLMFSPDGQYYGTNYVDFPEHRFLLAINSGHPGHQSIAAPLRALTGYWLAATFGLKWLLQFSQLYGVPFRWANYSDPNDKAKVCSMLETIGSSGWGAFPENTKLNFVDASKSASSLPQKELIEMADRQCDTFILGQTLTTDVGSSGSRALGEVHEGVRSGVIEGVAEFVADILNEQMLPSLIQLNYGDASEIPTIRADFERSRNEKEMAERDRVLFKDMGLPVEKSWLHERHRVPAPDPESDDLFQPSPDGAQGELETEASLASHETEGRLETLPVQVKASEEDFSTTIDKLSANVLEDLTGVTQEWVKPVKPFFDRLAALAMSKNVTDEDFTKALIEAQSQLPELFDSLNVEVLQDSLDAAIGTAMLAGSVERYEKND